MERKKCSIISFLSGTIDGEYKSEITGKQPEFYQHRHHTKRATTKTPYYVETLVVYDYEFYRRFEIPLTYIILKSWHLTVSKKQIECK